jgi:tRNA splicing endonuclease
MKQQNLHDLVALQLNVSSVTEKEQGTSKICSRFLIKEYIKQSDPQKLPDPAFVALQDGIAASDCANITSAFKERRGGSDGDLVEVSKKSKGVSLLYDRKILREQKDDEWTLSKEDFFHSDARKKAELLDERIAGGLFQHLDSTQFIVAVSYHGRVKTKSQEEFVQKQEYVQGMIRTSLFHKSYLF